MEAWKPRAACAFKPLVVGYTLLTLGLLAGLAAPAIPWYAATYSASGGGGSVTLIVSALSSETVVTSPGANFNLTIVNVILIGGAIVYAGLAFVFAAWAMALVAVIRVRGVARSGIAPPVSCCAPSMPAILGCVWTGFAVVLAGSGAAWALFRVAVSIDSPPISGLGPGASLLAFAVAAIASGAVLLSVASAMLGNLPGVGASRANCCCVEMQALEQPVGAAGAPVQQPGLQLKEVRASV